MFTDYKDKVVVVTGAAHGIGKAFAIGSAKRGADVVIADILGDDLPPVAKEIEALGRKAVCVTADVSLQSECLKIFDITMKEFGRCDFLVNNAGISANGSVLEIVEQDLNWVTETNLFSHFYMMKPFINQMMKQGNHCQILNVCSIAGLYTMNANPIYFATKHAAVALGESTYKWLKGIGANIDISIFCPGFVQTELYNADLYRPERYKKGDQEFYHSEAYKKYDEQSRYFLNNGRPLDEVIEEVFEQIAQGKFYILTHPQYDNVLRDWGKCAIEGDHPVDMSQYNASHN